MTGDVAEVVMVRGEGGDLITEDTRNSNTLTHDRPVSVISYMQFSL